MVEEDLAQQVRNAFYMGPDHEYLVIDQAHTEHFWEWFKEISIVFTVILTTENWVDERYVTGRCIGNSQFAAINNNIPYIEGFAGREGAYIFHGFNLDNRGVVDVTALNHPDVFEGYFGSLPNQYIGVEIPLDFVQRLNGAALAENNININPLLYNYYLECLN